MVVAIDPGVRFSYAAELDANGTLVSVAELVNSRRDQLILDPSTHVVIEGQELYRRPSRAKEHADPNDIVNLAFWAGVWAARAVEAGALVFKPKPKEWKGTLPKRVHHKRFLAALPAADYAVLARAIAHVPKTKQHNYIDAAALAKWGFSTANLQQYEVHL